MVNARQAKSAREKAAEMRAEAARREARSRAIVIVSAVLAAIVVVVGAGVIIQVARHNSDAKVQATSAPPRNLANGAFLVGKPDAKVTIQLYEDFQCPACKALEESDADLLTKLADQGKAKLEYRPVAILDRYSSTNYSSRALRAAGAVIDLSPSSFVKFHQLLMANQPPENGSGLTDAQLIAYAVQAGAPQAAMTDAVSGQKFSAWGTQVTDKFTQDFSPGATPTVVVNGKQLKDWSPDKLQAAVDAAAKG